MLEPKTIHAITRQVQVRFPEMSGCTPKVRVQAAPKSSRLPESASQRYLMTYHHHALLPSGEKIERMIRVVVDATGKILKITTSR